MKTNIIVSNNLLLAVDRLAERLEISRNDLVRKALERYLEQEGSRAPQMAFAAKHTDDDEEW